MKWAPAAANQILDLRNQGSEVNRSALLIAMDFVNDRVKLRSMADESATSGDGLLAGAALGRLNDLKDHKVVMVFGV